jgi:membrane-bound metal-dependent hydrolase YbcI (DUF457 family)
MPLPVAHSLAAATLYEGLDADGGARAWPRLLLAVVISNAPDLDLIPGIIAGEPNRYHHVGFSHSLLFAVAAGLAVGLLAAAAGKAWPLRFGRWQGGLGTALMVGGLLASHVLLDAFNRDFRPPPGVPMFWPLADAYVNIYPWFYEVAKLGGQGGPLEFVLSLMTVHNLVAMAFEALTLAPFLALVTWQRHRSRRRQA